MASLDSETVAALGDAVNSTWGKSSTARSGSPSCSITAQLVGDGKLMLKYVAIVSFVLGRDEKELFKRYRDESMGAIKEYVKWLKEEFKSRQDRALKLKLPTVAVEPSVEMITTSAYSPRRSAYFRNTVVVDVSV